MKTTGTIFAGIGTLALIGGLAACGTASAPAAAPRPAVTVTAPARAPATPMPTVTKTVAPAASPSGQTIIINNNPAPVSVNDPPAPVYYPSGAFLDTQTLVDSLADEQADELNAAPSYDYDSADNATISLNCDPDGYLTYACTGSDTDGDSGYGDIVTVLDNGNAWADTGMNWEGPDVYINGGVTNYWTTLAQADWQS
jgi:hypothetical protein